MKNIVLIGMPGVGKSTIGVVLAKNMGMAFIDSDLVIQEQYGKKLHELIDKHGAEGFIKIEDEINASINPKRAVIATGGSAVYGENAMQHFKDVSKIIYLKLSYESIEDRLGDLTSRGVVLKEGQSLKDLYEERVPLYEKYADKVIDCESKGIREIVNEISRLF